MPTTSEGIVPSDPDPTESIARSTIAARAESWRELLTQSSDLLHGYKDGGKRWARLRDLSGRFNLWASNMGVFAAVHASLDYRLRDLVDVKELVLEQLDYMVEGLTRFNTVLEDLETFSVAASGTGYEPQTQPAGLEEVEAILTSISTSIDWLHRLANMIRRASFVRQNEKASTFPLKNAQGDDLAPVYQQIFRHWIKRDFPNVADDLCERLTSSMLLRRRRIFYRRSRQPTLAPHAVKPAPQPEKRTADAPSASTGLSVPENISRVTQATAGVASTQHTATTLDPESYRRVVSTPSRVSEPRTISMTSIDKDIIPPPPRIALKELEFVCPFCCLILPASNARNRDFWGAHVKKDLDPYVCAFFPCAHGDDIMSTSADWVLHEQTHCMRWYCRSKIHGPQMFETQDEYITHMKDRHPGKFKEGQLLPLAENSRRPLKNIFDACPLCGERNGEEGNGLVDHVAHHLHYLALLSLPLPEDQDDAEYARSVPSIKSHDEETVAPSRTTIRSEMHAMPPAIFSYDDMNASEAALAVDYTIPDIDEQIHVEVSQLWKIIRMRKIILLQKDVLIGREEMKAWLSPADHTVIHKKAQNVRQEGSCQWLFQNIQFLGWKSQPAAFLWMCGVSGVGKTVLSSAIIDGLREDASGDGSSRNLIYFYFDRLDSRKSSLNAAITSLMSQLYYEQPKSQEHLDFLWLSCMEGEEQPNTQDLVSTFGNMLQDAGDTWLILDAFDECRPEDSHVEPELLTWLKNIQSRHPRLHLLVTSRGLGKTTVNSVSGFADLLHLRTGLNRQGILFDDIQAPSTTEQQNYGSRFLHDLEPFFDRISALSSLEENTRLMHPPSKIRIAVLDSGIDDTDTTVLCALRNGCINDSMSRSFVGQQREDWRTDAHGHGTHVTRLLLQTAPAAEIYIAQVCTGQPISDNLMPGIAKAIDWATQLLQVDIICMSFGFEEENDIIYDALQRAVHADTLIFAAASIGGFSAKRAWPARSEGVFCIHAADGYGNKGSMNPNPLAKRDNFSTLGVAVPSSWKSQEVWKTGTSFATPIAAGFAADVLEFAKYKCLSLGLEDTRRLREKRGMQAIFRAMAEIRDGYDFIYPVRLWKDWGASGDIKAEQDAATTIEMIMQDI